MNNEIIKQQYITYIGNRNIAKDTKTHKVTNMIQYFDMLTANGCLVGDSGLAEIDQFLMQKHYLCTGTINRIIGHLRELYKYLKNNNLLEKDCLYLIKYRKLEKPLPRNISNQMMLKLCTPTLEEQATLTRPIKMRNQAIIEFLYSTGVRNTELRTLQVNQLSPDLHRCWIVTQKGGVSRMVFLGRYARSTLYEYLQTRDIDCSNVQPHQKYEYVFLTQQKNFMTSQNLKEIVRNIAIKRIGAPVTPHMIRHTFATDMLRSHGCLRTLQKLMGHRSINSTARYCHLAMTDKIEAIEKFHPRNIVDKNKKSE